MRNENLKCWKDLTDSEKGALLLAKYEGREIEVILSGQWVKVSVRAFLGDAIYRVKTEPVIENVAIYGNIKGLFLSEEHRSTLKGITHKITYKVEDGEPVLDSIKMEKL